MSIWRYRFLKKSSQLLLLFLIFDLVVAAAGCPNLIQCDWIKPGAMVIDVGINSIKDINRKSGYRLVGDVNFDEVAPKTSFITPVPGGVGPMTVIMLMKSVVECWKKNLCLNE